MAVENDVLEERIERNKSEIDVAHKRIDDLKKQIKEDYKKLETMQKEDKKDVMRSIEKIDKSIDSVNETILNTTKESIKKETGFWRMLALGSVGIIGALISYIWMSTIK